MKTKTLTKKLKGEKKIFIPYIMAGDHERGLAGLQETIDYLNDHGVSAIELGIPFSDPVADGPVIELAGLRSLKRDTTLRKVIKELRAIKSDAPLILMTYFNPVLQYGLENLLDDLEATDVAGLIIPDLPYEHEDLLAPLIAPRDLALIRMVSITTDTKRQEQLVDGAQGFIYAVALNGVTGTQNAYQEELDNHLATLRDLSPIPVVTGFGISKLEDVARFHRVSDGVVVGSYIVDKLHNNKSRDLDAFISQAIELGNQ
ncbi:tryptophan synthase subunit alpha [Streptococcaceae bacterium ESL0729]|nr:tryptophan synthase subunit alpha [Streptococcaceae bacterium ESL0729]